MAECWNTLIIRPSSDMNLFYNKKHNVHTNLGRVLSVYLILFLIGCSTAPPPLTVAEARSMQTRTINAD